MEGMKFKRKRTKFTFDTYCAAIDRCLDGIDDAHSNYDKAKTVEESSKACSNLNYWSKLNVKIVMRRNREQLGMS